MVGVPLEGLREPIWPVVLSRRCENLPNLGTSEATHNFVLDRTCDGLHGIASRHSSPEILNSDNSIEALEIIQRKLQRSYDSADVVAAVRSYIAAD
ncbi:hypothetical protein KIV56_03955 [Cryobacterium breve]|uniref:Uncharacterized protein n=1 Tax=Cryobacterium breve TaxID=1259258 RepID=A0ABY7NDN5_9MICO|nr:hypothetical protein [Cryobacterium breve]WBM80591.1 hypothetical protein KIV56_03955 [Cryobacterium breve]